MLKNTYLLSLGAEEAPQTVSVGGVGNLPRPGRLIALPYPITFMLMDSIPDFCHLVNYAPKLHFRFDIL